MPNSLNFADLVGNQMALLASKTVRVAIKRGHSPATNVKEATNTNMEDAGNVGDQNVRQLRDSNFKVMGYTVHQTQLLTQDFATKIHQKDIFVPMQQAKHGRNAIRINIQIYHMNVV